MKLDLRTTLTYAVGGILMIGLIAFASKRHSDRQVKELAIEIIDHESNFFIDQLEVTNLINGQNTDYVLGLNMRSLDLKELERRVEANAFVSDAQVYRDISGSLQVRLIQAKPIARILNSKGADRYVDVSGNLLPLNTRHTARVPVVELENGVSWDQKLQENEFGVRLLSLLKYVEADPFWKAQIAHVIVDEEEEVLIIPQITKQEVILGPIEALDSKFKKLRIFYKKVLPAKGWNTYSYVNLKYENQIVCK